jgi:hypothetical protein
MRPASRWTAAVVAALAVSAGRSEAQTWRTMSSARQLQGESRLTVDVRYGVGEFRLAPTTGGELYRMELRYDEERFIPVRDYQPESGTLRLGTRSRDQAHVSLGRTEGDDPPYLDVALTDAVPLALTLELGAVTSRVDLGGLRLRRFTYRTGASETRLRFSRPNAVACEEMVLEVGAAQLNASGLGNANCARLRVSGGVGEVSLDFSGQWRQSLDADVNVGVGSLRLRVPRDVGVAVELNRFLASFDAPGFTKRGDTWYSENWDRARQRLTMRVNASFGGIEMTWLN